MPANAKIASASTFYHCKRSEDRLPRLRKNPDFQRRAARCDCQRLNGAGRVVGAHIDTKRYANDQAGDKH